MIFICISRITSDFIFWYLKEVKWVLKIGGSPAVPVCPATLDAASGRKLEGEKWGLIKGDLYWQGPSFVVFKSLLILLHF